MVLHSFHVGETSFTVDQRYQFVSPAGRGTYATVCCCQDAKTGAKVAIKKLENAFRDARELKRLFRELRLLRHFRHDNVCFLRDICSPPTDGTPLNDIYEVMEHMDTTLHHILVSKQPLSDEHYRYFLYQILRGLKFLHAANVIHRDMKPSNLLVNENCDLKICDLGLARYSDNDQNEAGGMTEYVVTRWYRPPELLFGAREYTNAVDMWSVGCILAEMIRRMPLFPGHDYYHQLCLIIDVLGTPSTEDIARMSGGANADHMIAELPSRPAIPFGHLCPGAPPAAVDLLSKLLVYNPADRISVDAALAHPYLAPLYDLRDPVLNATPEVFDPSLESVDDPRDLSQLVVNEILGFHPELEVADLENRIFRVRPDYAAPEAFPVAAPVPPTAATKPPREEEMVDTG